MKQLLKTILFILAGSVLYALGISVFLAPNQLASGGVTGIAIILNHISSIPIGTITLLINIPLILLGLWKFGIKFLFSTTVTVVLSSLLINIFEPIGALTNDLLLCCLAGGSLLSIGIGFIFKAGATTGGSDILVRLLRLKFKHIKTGKIFLLTDSVVILLSAIVFRDLEIALYAALCVVIQSFVLDIVLYGTDGARLIYIISDHHTQIAQTLLEKLSIGATYMDGSGAFTQQNKKVILCAMRKQLLPQAREIVLEADENAFMIITSANEVFGEGFKEHTQQDL